MKRKNPQTIGARRKQESVVRAAEARRERREAAGAPAVQPKTADQLDAEARGLLRQHRIRESPASIRLAKLHCQSTDAVDALYDICVTRGKEPRLVSAMVSAGKLAVSTLDKLGLPGDLDTDDFPAPPKPTKVTAEPASKPDTLEAWE